MSFFIESFESGNDSLVSIGEKVLYNQAKDSSELRNKLDSQGSEGVWVGLRSVSNESVIATESGVIKCFAITIARTSASQVNSSQR